MMFLNCPAYLDHKGAVRCGLPAEVRCRFTMRSTDGPVEGVMIRCPAGHCFTGAIESLTWDGTDNHDPGPAGLGSRAAGAPPPVTCWNPPSAAVIPPWTPASPAQVTPQSSVRVNRSPPDHG